MTKLLNRPFKAFPPVVALLAVGLIASGAAPARAGEASWSDPTGDASEFSVITSTPLPSNDALDMISNDVQTVGGNVVWRVKVKQMPETGYPQHSTGYFFRMMFTWEEKVFEFGVGDGLTVGQTFELHALEPFPGVPVGCVGCTGVIDRQTSNVTITAPVAALAAGMKEAFPDLPAFGPGAELAGLLTRAQRDLGLGGKRPASADTAEAPGELTYIV